MSQIPRIQVKRIPLQRASQEDLIKQIVSLQGLLSIVTDEEALKIQNNDSLIRVLVRLEDQAHVSENSDLGSLGTNRNIVHETVPSDSIAMDGSCSFALLFEHNCDHILKIIFLSIDYKTFKSCHSVCREWNNYLKSPSFQRVANSVFSAYKWADVKGTERKWINSVHIFNTNGKEVAYVTDDNNAIVNYINNDGEEKSVDLSLDLDHNNLFVLTLQIMHNVMLFEAWETENKLKRWVCSISKQTMKVSKLFETNTWETTHFDPVQGYQSVVDNYDIETDTTHFLLFQVSLLHGGKDCWVNFSQTKETLSTCFNNDCCSVKDFYCLPGKVTPMATPTIEISEDGSKIVLDDCDEHLHAFAIGKKEDSPMMIWSYTKENSWEDYDIDNWETTTEFLILTLKKQGILGGYVGISVICLEDGSQVKQIELSKTIMGTGTNVPRHTKQYFLAFLILELDEEDEYMHGFLMLNLKSLNYEVYNTRLGMYSNANVSLLSTFNEGQMAVMEFDRKLYLLDLKSGDPKEVFNGRKRIKMEEKSSGKMSEFRYHDEYSFHEVTKELCLITRRFCDKDRHLPCGKVWEQTVAIKPAQLSKGLNTWLDLIEVKNPESNGMI